jgi:predicted HTH domain antitoxin
MWISTDVITEVIRRMKKVVMKEEEMESCFIGQTAAAEWKKEYAARLYADGSVTLERAAMDAGVSVREMMEYLKAKRVPAQYDVEDLEEDMKNFYKRMGK